MNKGLKADLEKCTGCQMCMLVCSASHVGKFNPSESRINVEDVFPEPGEFKFNYCIHCDEHPCVEACPVEAIKLNEKLGTYYVDKELCTACGTCVAQCPVGALSMNEDLPQVAVDICIACFCCQEICPEKAIALV